MIPVNTVYKLFIDSLRIVFINKAFSDSGKHIL
jgi:hypothetical protein